LSAIDPQPAPPGPLSLIVRDAHHDDHATIVEFNIRLAAETESKPLDRGVLDRGVALALTDPERLRYWLAETREGGKVVGQAAVSREWSDWRNGWVWWLQSVFVHPDYRRRGVFRTPHQQIRSQARSAPDIIGLRLYVESANDRAQQTYQALGLVPGGYQVYEEFWPERFQRMP